MNHPVRTAFVKECDLHGCKYDCDEIETMCAHVPVVIIQIDEAEMENLHVKGRLQFGQGDDTPWTDRKIDAPLEGLRQRSVKLHAPLL